jgi:AAA domain-containing protein
MKLGELKTQGSFKILVYGASGSGKTCFGVGFDGPTLLLDFDGKADSAAIFYKNNEEKLDNVDVRNLAGNFDSNPMEALEKIINTELIPQQKSGEMKFKTLILDSLTTFSAQTLNYIIKTNAGVKRMITKQGPIPCMQDYMILRREFQKLIPGILSLPCNIIMLGHIATEKDESTGEIFRGPHMDGSFARDLPIYFKEVYRSYVNEKGEHWLQTKSDNKYECRSQIAGLPNPMKMDAKEILKCL